MFEEQKWAEHLQLCEKITEMFKNTKEKEELHCIKCKGSAGNKRTEMVWCSQRQNVFWCWEEEWEDCCATFWWNANEADEKNLAFVQSANK